MACLAIDGDGILPLADVVQDGLVLVELLEHLVEIADLQIRAEADLSAVGTELAEKDAQQGCFAAAIGAEYPDPVALHDGR